jgi:hypothetical protein
LAFTHAHGDHFHGLEAMGFLGHFALGALDGLGQDARVEAPATSTMMRCALVLM